MKKIILAAFLIFSLAFANAQTLLDEAVELNVKDIHGNVYSLFEILDSGKHVVIDFYSASCGYCQLYAPDVQASYIKFGENSGEVFFMTIDKGHTNAEIAEFDETYGVTMPSVSGLDGGGNIAHLLYEIQATPSVILIAPDYSILEQMIWPATTENIDAALLNAGLTMVGNNEMSDAREINVFPNPAYEKLFIDVSGLKNPQVAILYDMTGTERYSVSLKNIEIAELSFSSKITKGVYFLKIFYDYDKVHAEKVIVSE